MKNSVMSNSRYLFNLKMLAVVLFVACSVQDIKSADSSRSKKSNEREKNIKQLIQRHNLWNLREMLDKHSLCNQVRRVKDNFQEIENIAQFSAQLQTKIDAFQTAIDNCHPTQQEIKQDLQAIHTHALLPMPGIITQFFVGRIRQGTDLLKPTCYTSMHALAQWFEPKTTDLSLFHKQLVYAGTTYKRRLKKNYSVHKKSGDMPDRQEGAILDREYKETIAPFIKCIGVLGHIEKNKPEAFEQALLIWHNTRDLTQPKL